jgi:hypothetical protein
MIYYETLFFPRSPIPGVICEDRSCPVIFFWHVYPPVERFYRYCKSCRPSLMAEWLASDERARRYQQTRPRRFGRLLRQRFPENYPTTLLEDDSEYLSRHPTLGVSFNPSNPPPDWDRAGRYTGFDVDDDASTIVPSTPSTERQFYNAHPEPADADGDFPDDFSDASTEVEVVWSGFSGRRLEIHTPRDFVASTSEQEPSSSTQPMSLEVSLHTIMAIPGLSSNIPRGALQKHCLITRTPKQSLTRRLRAMCSTMLSVTLSRPVQGMEAPNWDPGLKARSTFGVKSRKTWG